LRRCVRGAQLKPDARLGAPAACRTNTQLKVLRADVASPEAAAVIVAALAANTGLEQLALGGPVPEQLRAMIAMRCSKNGAGTSAGAAGLASPVLPASPLNKSPAGGLGGAQRCLPACLPACLPTSKAWQMACQGAAPGG
jgi:hypothetical protein